MSIIFGRFRRVSVVVLLLLSLTAAMGGGAAAQGNSENAKLCQKGGWANLAKAEDTSTAFTNQGACVSYGAQGGDIVELGPTTPTLYFADGEWTDSGCTVDLWVGDFPGGIVNVVAFWDGDAFSYINGPINAGTDFSLQSFSRVSEGVTLTATATYPYGGQTQTVYGSNSFTCVAPV